MGIERRLAEAIVREHAWKPIRGDVVLIARQTMFFSPEDAIGMLRRANLPVPQIEFQQDTQTRSRATGYIRDDDFFRLLGVPRVKALDVSDYEGADIVCDLTEPLPLQLENTADFLLDGSTLDNVFDPATTLRNFARLLKPGGRLVSISAGSNHYDPYVILTPLWLFDYFVVNHFADCRVYLSVYDGPNRETNVLTPDLTLLRSDRPHLNNLTSDHSMGIVIIAEKGPHSTWQRTPIQHQYRHDWKDYESGLREIMKSTRPHHMRSLEECFMSKAGWLYVDQHGHKSVAKVPPPPPSPPAPPLDNGPQS